MNETENRAPLVLLSSGGEWLGRSLENVLEASGYSVLRVDSGRRAIELARRVTPEAILLDDSLGDIAAVDVCRALRDDPLFDHATPIFITASAPHASRVRAAAYAAGAWDYCTLPVDADTLIAKLGTFVRARQEIHATRSKQLFDALTGLYTEDGLEHWLEWLSARALRKREAIAVVAIAPEIAPGSGPALADDASSDALATVSEVCRYVSRRSDVVGQVGASRLVILAPDTDASGVERLVERLQEAAATADRSGARRRASSIRAGYCAVPNLADANLTPTELVRRAQAALDYASPGRRTHAAVNFDELPLS